MTKKWWNDKIVYQVYPKSFKDSNGDGIGDVKGITQKLDYLHDLGVDILWISPIYQSPMKDNGYDISNYYEIDPIFGTMEDMEELIQKSKEKGIRILMDLVVNHCSFEHDWFKKALKDPLGKYGQYFIIKEGKDGKEPNNWRSIFGGSVWDKIEGTSYYYYHTFAKEQPDLNWENEDLRQEIYNMMNYWLAKGLGGFRVDAITYIKKDASYESLPADGPDGLANLMEVSANYPGIEVFLREMREKTFDIYDAFSVAEMSGVNEEKLEEYIGEDGFFSSIFDFSYMEVDIQDFKWYRPVPVNAQMIKEKLFLNQDMAQRADSFLSAVLENHDQPRVLSKWFASKDIGYESATMVATLNLMLRGIPFIYQGEEIGMTNATLDHIEKYDDIMTFAQYDLALMEGCTKKEGLHMANRRSRDHARTPMQWDSSENAGFTTGEPWIFINDNYKEINVKNQGNPSILSYYKKLIAFRKSKEWKEVLTYGEFCPALTQYKDCISYSRILGKKELVIVLNYLNTEQTIKLNEKKELVMTNYDHKEDTVKKLEIKEYVLKPYEAIILK